MDFRIFLLLFFSHLLCDFIFQGKSIFNMRFSKDLKKGLVGNAIHSCIHFLLMLFLLSLYYFLDKPIKLNILTCFKISFYIAFMHFVIDEAKSLTIKFKASLENDIVLFIIDQALHVTAIVFIASSLNINGFLKEVVIIINTYPSDINIIDRWLVLSIIFLLCTWVSGVFIRKYISNVNLKAYSKLIDSGFIVSNKVRDTDTGARDGGFIIGILERTFILLVMAIGQPQMIGFVLTAKSIARFKKLDDSSFAEYFIIGTFISFITAIAGGIIIRSLNIIPIIK